MRTAGLISPPHRAHVLARITLALVRAGKPGEKKSLAALTDVAASLKGDPALIDALGDLAEAQAGAGDVGGAFRTVDRIEHLRGDPGTIRYKSDEARDDIAGAQAEAGDVDAALRTAGSIKGPG